MRSAIASRDLFAATPNELFCAFFVTLSRVTQLTRFDGFESKEEKNVNDNKVTKCMPRDMTESLLVFWQVSNFFFTIYENAAIKIFS